MILIHEESSQRIDSGQSLIEFAISLVFIVVLLAGVIDLGRAFFAYIIVRDAAQEGALYGAVAKKDNIDDFKNRVSARVRSAFTNPDTPSSPPLNLSDLEITTEIIGSPCAEAEANNSVRVTVDYQLPITMPFLGSILGAQEIKMSTSAEDTIMVPVCSSTP